MINKYLNIMSGILKDYYDKMNIYEVVRRLNINNIKVSM